MIHTSIGVLVLVGCLITVVLCVPAMRERMARLRNLGSDSAVGSRMLMSRIGLEMFADRPVSGWGAGAYAYQYLDRLGAVLPEDKTPEILNNVVFAREAHNDYIQFAAEFGVVGLVLAAGLVGCVALRLWKEKREDVRWRAVGAYVMVYMGFHCLVSFALQMAVAGPVAAFIVGGCVSSMEWQVGGHEAKAAVWRVDQGFRGVWLAIGLCMATWSLTEVFLGVRAPSVKSGRDAEGLAGNLARVVPWSHRYQALLGGIVAHEGKFGSAIDILERAERGFEDVSLLNNLGHCYARLGHWEDALRIYEKWAKAGVSHREALDNVSVALENLGRFSDAADVMADRAALWPDWGTEYNMRRCVMLMKGKRYGDGLKHVEMFFARKETYGEEPEPEFDNVRRAFLLRLGRIEEARRFFQRAIQRKPDLESAKRNLELLERVER